MFEYMYKKFSKKKHVKKITLGVCAMDKKSRSKPMNEILARFPSDLFDIVIFGDDCILNQPVDTWPIVECLIAFYSNHYPLEKALEYIRLRKPFLINDPAMQSTLSDRRKVYQLLEANAIDVPFHIFVNREEGQEDTNEITECDEHIIINGVQLKKPFVEKPVDADDHNIYIYYPMSAGGGSKRLFRKVDDRSSEHYRKINEIRRTGSFIYEEFLVTQGTDVKVYTVGPDYGHAEARKSPVVDGKVIRNKDGLEVRYPVILSAHEKEISRRITLAFHQTVCGFDILRVPGKSYVCDVNGFSFVKNSRKYYDDCSLILVELMMTKLRPEYHATLSAVQPLLRPSQRLPSNSSRPMDSYKDRSGSTASPFDGSTDSPADFCLDSSMSSMNPGPGGSGSTVYDQEELVCVIGVFRHGDRTPKQKIKLKVKESAYLDYYHEHTSSAKKDLKVKSKSGLEQFLRITRELIERSELSVDGSKKDELMRKLKSIRFVLERWEISGINRKLQMKPLNWEEAPVLETRDSPAELFDKPKDDSLAEVETAVADVENPEMLTKIKVSSNAAAKSSVSGKSLRATEVLLILKWGGDLTPHGRVQAAQLGADFRDNMYPHPSGGGMLRLHSTFRHDLKIKASDEGRVMKTAAAFTKGMLELEGNLTPLLVSLVSVEEKNSQMLDHYGNLEIKQLMDLCKTHIHNEMQRDVEITVPVQREIAPSLMVSVKEALKKIKNPREALCRIHELLGSLCDEIRCCYEISRTRDDLSVPPSPGVFRDRSATGWPSKEGEFAEAIVPAQACSGVKTESPLVASIRRESLDGEDATGSANALDRGTADLSSHDDVTLAEAPSLSSTPFRRMGKETPTGDRDTDSDGGGLISLPDLYLRETYDLMLTRWEKLYKDFYHKETDLFDLTKVPDVYDMVRYDLIHNPIPQLPTLAPLFDCSRLFSVAVVPQEYGIGVDMKRFLGAKMCHALLEKILKDIQIARSNSQVDMTYLLDLSHADDLNIRTLGRSVRTRLYFTSESHLHTLLNVLRYPLPDKPKILTDEGVKVIGETEELSYLTYVVFRIFERKSASEDDPKRFRCEICFSPGACADPRIDKSTSLSPSFVLNSNLPCDDLIEGLKSALELSNTQHNEFLTEAHHDYNQVSSAPQTPSKSMFKRNISSPEECSDEWESDALDTKQKKVVKPKSSKKSGKPPLGTVAEGSKSFGPASDGTSAAAVGIGMNSSASQEIVE